MGVLYVLEDDVYISRDGGQVKVARRRGREVLLAKPLISVEEIVVMGNAVVTPALLRACVEQGIGIHYVTKGGSYYAQLISTVSKNAPARIGQLRAYLDPNWKLQLAKSFVIAKIRNSQTFIRRGAEAIAALDDAVRSAGTADCEETLRGVEGNAAAAYYSELAKRLPDEFEMNGRSRRPPRDRVNSILSLAYTFLTREGLAALHIAGLDPYVGYLHEVKYGKPALALDLIEEFRAVLADSVVLILLNKGMLSQGDFTEENGYPTLTKEGFVKFLSAWEQRMTTRVQHPVLRRKLTYRQVLVAQGRLLAKHVSGELEVYAPFLAK